MGLFHLEKEDIYCIYNFKKNEIVERLYGDEHVKVIIDNKPIDDVIKYKNKQWCLLNSGYIGQDLNGIDIAEQTLIGALKKVIKNILK